MKKLILFVAFLFSIQLSNAQFGVSAGYKPIQAKNWDQIINEHQLNVTNAKSFANGIHLGVDYWFRLKNYRVEFLPELSYSRFSRFWANEDGLITEEKIGSNFVGFHFNTNFYVFDFKGDCDCPTFSKDGNDMQKGFFIQVAPGVDYVFNTYKNDEISETSTDVVPSVGIGVGIDFGLNNFMTITPMVKVHQYFGVNWDGLNTYFENGTTTISPELNENNITQFFAGIRIGLRLDANQY